jgi:hypothetical protein
MTRYILVDIETGHIWGDSARVENPQAVVLCDPVAYARVLDASFETCLAFEYDQVSSDAITEQDDGYHVFVAPGDFPKLRNGENRDEIMSVWNRCRYIMTLRRGEGYDMDDEDYS